MSLVLLKQPLWRSTQVSGANGIAPKHFGVLTYVQHRAKSGTFGGRRPGSESTSATFEL